MMPLNRRQMLLLPVANLYSGTLLRGDDVRTQPTFDELTNELEAWQRDHSTRFKLEVPGRSVQGRPVFAAILTDTSVVDEDKEHVLITTTHSGIEKGGSAAALRLIEWMLSSDSLAQETLRRQVIVVMPACNPDGFVKPAFVNDHGFDAYMDWNVDGPQDPSKMPEAVAIQAMMDRWQPEVFSDIHGNDYSFPGYIHFEGHVNNPSLRSYEPEIERLMDEAALAEGFPTHRGEADEQRLFIGAVPGVPMEKQARKKPRIFAGTYAYLKYHTLTLATENAWPQSCLARHQRLLRVGNEVWPGELYRGYPTRTILTHSHQIVAHGRTAAERRRSRVELWNKQSLITHGFSNPQIEGFTMYLCATTSKAAQQWFAVPTLQGFQRTIQNHPRLAANEILKSLRDHPDGPGQWGTEAKLALVGSSGKKVDAEPVQHGLALRLRIPYAKSTIKDLRLNGFTIAHENNTDCTTWIARGYRFIQIELPPERLQTDDLFVVTCRYEPGEQREVGWR